MLILPHEKGKKPSPDIWMSYRSKICPSD